MSHKTGSSLVLGVHVMSRGSLYGDGVFRTSEELLSVGEEMRHKPGESANPSATRLCDIAYKEKFSEKKPEDICQFAVNLNKRGVFFCTIQGCERG